MNHSWDPEDDYSASGAKPRGALATLAWYKQRQKEIQQDAQKEVETTEFRAAPLLYDR
jgi:hypothetical protein